jgi:hypothetical protein
MSPPERSPMHDPTGRVAMMPLDRGPEELA